MPSIMREPAAELLARHGIGYKTSIKGAVTWFNLDECPLCLHKGGQCGISESIGENGKLIHGFKCWHGDSTDPRSFYASLGYPEDILSKTTPKTRNNAASKDVKPDVLARANPETLATNRKRLRENVPAMDYLFTRGLSSKTIEHFRLGLTRPYKDKDGNISSNCLIYPLFNRHGQPVKKNAYYNIPGVSENPRDPNGWMAGEVMCYYGADASSRKKIFVCEGAKDLWRLWQEVQGTDLDRELLLVTSTHGSAFPREWKDPEYWSPWDTIYFGQDNDDAGERIVSKLVEYVGRDALRVRVPASMGKDWTDYFRSGGTIEDFRKLLGEASPVTRIIKDDEEEKEQFGLLAYRPVDINGSFHKGHLYYTVQALMREKVEIENEEGGREEQIQEAVKTVVVRSDGAILSAVMPPAPKGTPPAQRVLRLTDGTLVSKMPAPSPYATWSWPSINRFHRAKSEGEKVRTRPLPLLVNDIRDYLRNQVWLPHADDYTLLALAAVATYVQPVFDAVPLFLVNGPKGSGKTELGRAMKDVCANSALVGQGSAATIARLIDMSRGFVVLDDIESIGNNKVDAQFSELIQGLKLSYKKSTAAKIWTDIKTMKVEKLNFFGIKMINNTTGVDAILGSRMFVIQTRKRLPQEITLWEASRSLKAEPPAGLRDDLHTWAFEQCIEVSRAYQKKHTQGGERADEIAAPLRVIAGLTDDGEIRSTLEVALARQGSRPKQHDDPLEILEEALANLVIEGFREIMIQHVALEMRLMVPDNYGQERTTEIPEIFRPEWIGRQLRMQGWLEETNGQRRVRLFGMSFRAFEIALTFIAEVTGHLEKDGKSLVAEVQQATDFCQGCEGCRYRNTGCDIMPKRLDAEERLSKGKWRLQAVGR